MAEDEECEAGEMEGAGCRDPFFCFFKREVFIGWIPLHFLSSFIKNSRKLRIFVKIKLEILRRYGIITSMDYNI